MTSNRALLFLTIPLLSLEIACSEAGSKPGEASGSSGATASGGTTSMGGAGAGGSNATAGNPPNGGGVTASSGSPSGGANSAGSLATGGSSGSESGGGGAGVSGTGGNGGAGGMGGGGEAGTAGADAGGSGGTPMAGGGGTSMSGGGAGGSPDTGFQPCPAMEPCKILPLGDSITFGLGFDGGYRVELFRLALADDHEITFTGTQSPNGPSMVEGVSFPRNHEGISGQTIQQIADRVPSPALNEMPHIILLHAGTNDMAQNANGADARLGDLMDELIAEAPDALVVVSSIIPLSFGGGSLDSFNATIPGMVEERADAGAHIIFADQFEGFPTSELGDGVHPNQEGYARMARVWYEAISAYLR